MTTTLRRPVRASIAAFVVLGSWWLIAPPVVSATPADTSGTIEEAGHKITYSLSGVEAADGSSDYDGTVTAKTATLSGSGAYSIDEGGVTNLGMSASLSVLDQSAGDSWPPPGTDGRVSGTTITFPFNLTVEIPPPPEPEDAVPPFGAEAGDAEAEPEPYGFLAFRVESFNCNDSGVCDGASASGSFTVFASPTSTSPTVDWIATVGALGAAAAAAAAAGIIGRKGESSDDDDPDRWRYVLQVVADEVSVDTVNGGHVDVEVWAVNDAGTAMAAPSAAVTATPSGPFSVTPSSSQGALHADITTSGPPGSTGSLAVSAVAGPMTMSTTVGLTAIGTHRLELAPVGEPVLRPDAATGRYTPLDVDLRIFSGAEAVVGVLTGTETSVDGIVALTQSDAPGTTPAIRLCVTLDVDPASLVDPVNQQVELTVWAEPSDVDEPETLTGSITIRLEPPSATVHWMQTGRPETLDSIIVLEAEEDSVLDLEVWLESTNGAPPPAAEFSHMANVDLANRQLAPTKDDFSCHPDSKPWQKPAADDRAHSRWRVNHALLSPNRPDLEPPIDTAVRVRAWKSGTVTRDEESITSTEGRLAEALVPIRLVPLELVVELVDPADPVPADGLDHDVTLRVLRMRDREPHVGAVHLGVKPVDGRATSTVKSPDVVLGPDDAGTVVASLTTPELTYARDITYTEILQVGMPGGADTNRDPADVAVALAPAVSLIVTRAKKGLLWDQNPTLDWTAADGVSTVSGQVRATATQSHPPKGESDVVVVHADVGAVVPPDALDSPVITAKTEKMGRVEFRLPGLVTPGDATPVELDFDQIPRGVLAPEIAERLDLYEARVSSRVERSRRPLSALVGDAHASTLGAWRFETLRKLAEESEERFEDIVGAIELAEADATYTDAFSTIYYDMVRQAADDISALLGDLMSFAFTVGGVGEKLAKKVVNPLGSWSVGMVDDYLVQPGISALRSVARRIVGLVDDLLRLIDIPSAGLNESARAIKELWETISNATDLGKILESGVDLLMNAVLYLSRAVHALVVKAIRKMLPLTQSIMKSLAPAIGVHLDPGWNKLCEDSLKQFIDQIGAVPWVAGGITDQIGSLLDPYPIFATRATDSVLRDLDALRVPADPAGRRDMAKEHYGSFSREAFAQRQAFATADECLAWFNLIATAVQLILIGKAAAKGLLEVAAKLATESIGPIADPIGKMLDKIDIFAAAVNGLVHGTELIASLAMGYSVAIDGTGTVKALT